ncbi:MULTISPECIES: flagellar hook assembly protein FlgD [unclassified Sedimentibacter]|uniref:flagellar hook assembly protein FlgD n=1 Tax=unclassified Sedimentibacter TaxID=2649220 RepID=UPI0027E0A8A7|nr:flagellar hook capping FlgD N-terminal domain-containing protein [Sedimentibacter sp. MB35-C1]WMJ78601.1 flagellar hook capping FlgD N-terminal domain-containing protein [Sedimentibacter sp. MB35-C1]
MEINAYNSTYSVNSSGGTNNLNVQNESESLDMQDFLNLLVAQLTNQDTMNPMENTEFISQMAQFSSLQAMSDLTEISMQGQATSLIGKQVVVAEYNSRGELDIEEGVVQRVTIFGGGSTIYVNDKEYSYLNVMEIKQAEEPETDPVQEILTDILEGINGLNDSLQKHETTAVDLGGI